MAELTSNKRKVKIVKELKTQGLTLMNMSFLKRNKERKQYQNQML